MFTAGGPQKTARGTVTIAGARNFGGALANSRKGIDLVQAGTFANKKNLPDYNLDGDRGYGWPCWDVSPAVTFNPATNKNKAPDPLAPDAPENVPPGAPAELRASQR